MCHSRPDRRQSTSASAGSRSKAAGLLPTHGGRSLDQSTGRQTVIMPIRGMVEAQKSNGSLTMRHNPGHGIMHVMPISA
jgi:hypothetical protein